MSLLRPVYLLSPRDSAPPADLVPGLEIERVPAVEALAGRPPGLLLLPAAELTAGELVGALAVAAGGGSGERWMPVLIDHDEGGAPRARPLSVGWPTAPAELARWAAGSPEAAVLELRHVLERLARARHDLNNPLTSAMAETQLALMDAQDPELRLGLETIEEQLRRIRDLIAELRVLRLPR